MFQERGNVMKAKNHEEWAIHIHDHTAKILRLTSRTDERRFVRNYGFDIDAHQIR